MDINITKHARLEHRKNRICLFEASADAPLHRHSSESSASATKNTYFVVRTVSVLGDYDHTIDYVFYPDGSVEVKVRTSGIAAGNYYADSGSQENGNLQDNIHDSIFNFKVDIDIAGEENTIYEVLVEEAEVSRPWTPGHLSKGVVQKAKPITHEVGMKELVTPGRELLILNENSPTAQGRNKGYKITQSLIQSHTTYDGTKAEWAKSDIWLSKHKDTECRSSNPSNTDDPRGPLINFSKFIDGEIIKQEDM